MKGISLIIFCWIGFISCSKDDKKTASNQFDNTPLAKSNYNNSNYGIYKGVFIGSSGNVVINVNNDNSLSATLKINGAETNYASSQIVTQNQPSTITFTNGSNSFQFNSNASGSNTGISNIIIGGHPYPGISVLKEKSDSLVKCFEGTFKENVTNGATGTLNWQLKGAVISGLIVEEGAVWPPYITIGTLNGNQINGSCPYDPIVHLPQCTYGGTTLSGSLSADVYHMTGTFSNCYGSGTWKADRTR